MESKPLPQTTPGLIKEIQAYGCMFRSVQAMAEIKLGKVLTVDQINEAWKYAIQAGWLAPKNGYYLLMQPVELSEYTFKQLWASGGRFANVKVENHDGTYWIPAWYKTHDYVLQSNFSGSAGGVHYRLMDATGELVFDPWPGLNLGTWAQKSYYQYVG